MLATSRPGPDEAAEARDRESRERAVDPRFNVALEASAGTGKTRVLVHRYVNLLRAGVDPANILAMTFTRKAAAEMRERIVSTLRTAAARGELPPAEWRAIRDRLGDIAIGTIDAFCLSLLREFPLEADLDPGFTLADDTEVPRLVDESLDRAVRICRNLARDDEHVALVFAQLGDRRVRFGLADLLNRRLVAPAVLSRHAVSGPRNLTLADAAARAAAALRGVFASMPGGEARFYASGPPVPALALLRRQLERLRPDDATSVNAAFAKAREYFLTHDGRPRSRMAFTKAQFRSAADFNTHRDLVVGHAGAVRQAYLAYRRDLNVLVSRGVWRMFRVAESEYRRTLEAHAVLDFPEVLLRTLGLLRQMEEFSQSRYRLESRYHHVLVDEFQDTSRAQWELIALLVAAWGEGSGLVHTGPLPPSIFIVGDRKQSIYGFRDAQPSILREAAAHLDGLRPDGGVRRSISRSFRAVPALLAFVNDVCVAMDRVDRPDAFRYEEDDRFPTGTPDVTIENTSHPVSYVAAASPEACAEQVAGEIARLLESEALVRDRDSGLPRPVRPADIAILFRTRESHRLFEEALDRRAVPAYVYKGLGFFDADEVKDVLALILYLADPLSELRAAAFLRSRFIRISDEGLRRLAPRLAEALQADDPLAAALDAADFETLTAARRSVRRWSDLADRIPPAELLDQILRETAYAFELRGRRAGQARENLKKLRSLVRRIQNRGYATLGRIAAQFDRLAAGDEANAVVDAMDAVNLMTVHAAKGLEFPVVFVVNLGRGTGSPRADIRITAAAADGADAVAVGDFQSEADDEEERKDREETKRLLYVALTRARDRLYLSSPLQEGRLVAGRGSLAEVLPAFVVQAIERSTVAAAPEPLPAPAAPSVTAMGEAVAADREPLVDTARHRVSAESVVADEGTEEAAAGGGSSRLIGVIVHRLLQRIPPGAPLESESLAGLVRAVLRPEDLAGEDDSKELIARAGAAFRAFREIPEVVDIYASGRALPEVPFTMAHERRIVRGTIDCLVLRRPAGGGAAVVSVLEFKTGGRRESHQKQANLYTRAVQAAYPTAIVDVRLFYIARNHSGGSAV